MTIRTKNRYIALMAAVALWLVSYSAAMAMDASRHAQQSVLAQGRWVKVSVETTGMHFLSKQALASMGFNDPGRVRVYGYGGKRLPDVLDPDTYVDDLPQVQSHNTANGVYFYAEGPYTVGNDAAGHTVVSPNPFSTHGYYFITDSDDSDKRAVPESGYAGAGAAEPATVFVDWIHHETDSYSPGESGHYLVGEDLRYTPARSFKFTLTDPAEGEYNLGASILTDLVSAASWTLEVQGGAKKTVAAAANSSPSTIHGNISTTWLTFDKPSTETITATISLAGGSTNVRSTANIDWLTLNYPRQIKLPSAGGALSFSAASPAVRVAGAGASTVVWDVTDPLDISALALSQPDAQGNVYFTTAQTGPRHYAAFNTDNAADLPAPSFVENVANQNLHGLNNVDMVIFTPSQWISAARNLASYRSGADGITVEVVNQDQVFNEFSSGTRDINAMRKLMKMLYDRYKSGSGTAPRYALLFGRSTFDNRMLTSATSTMSYKPLPLWQTDGGLSETASYPTDDILGFLDDYSGAKLGNDTLCVAVGRLPVTSLTQANLLVDKIMEYENSSPQGSWRARGVFIADDDNSGIHMSQTEDMIGNLQSTEAGCNMLVDKIYIDAYDYVNGTAVGARDEFYRALDEGTVWINYVGHANSTQLSSEGILNYSDMGSLFLKKLPFIYAATCDFMRWDATTVSGAERLALTKGGGVIGAITATRQVYISNNGMLTAAMGHQLMRTDSQGKPLTIGQMLQRAKNTLAGDENKLRYCLLGDPSMRLNLPTHSIVIETVDGAPYPFEGDRDAVLKARQDVALTGSVRDGMTGELLSDFNGTLNSTLYDADLSVTSLGHGSAPARYTFDKHGLRLFVGTDTIVGGRFTLNVAMPAEVADNYRPATLALFATDNGKTRTAAKVERGLYVYGIDEEAVKDTVPPSIDAIYLNHPSFTNGGTVNSSPMLIADISDNHAINMSLAGIGHWMSLSLDDGAITYNDVSNFYEPESIEKGRLYYQLSDLENGVHTLTLRVWDSAGNSASRTIEFFVDNSSQPQVFDIYPDRNPASETTNFYLVHDRPDGDLKVEIMVYDMLGRVVWTNTSTGRADKFKSYPITWNLTDSAGRRVQRGIYLYRAVVSDLNGSDISTVTPAKKIAVTSR